MHVGYMVLAGKFMRVGGGAKEAGLSGVGSR